VQDFLAPLTDHETYHMIGNVFNFVISVLKFGGLLQKDWGQKWP